MDVKKILVIRTSALGDVVHVLPAVSALRELYPHASISWFIEPAAAGLVAGHPLIEKFFVFDRPRWKKSWRRPSAWPGLLGGLWRIVRALRAERFDLVVDFQCNVRSGAAVLFSGGRTRLGFARADSPEWGGRLFTNLKAPRCPRGIHKVEKNLALVRALGWQGEAPRPILPVPEEDRAWAREVIAALPGSGPAVMLHPAVSRFGDFKRWPVSHYRELIDLARSKLDARVLITWGPGERELAESIGRPTVAPPIESPSRLAALAASSDALVAADTGALHIAAALGTATVGIFGPKDERIYGPFPPAPHLRAIRSGVPCSPCKLRRCEHRICMSMVFPEEVLRLLEEALAASTAGQKP